MYLLLDIDSLLQLQLQLQAFATSSISMTTRRAIQIESPGEARLVEDVPIPSLRDDFIIVKPQYVALNPTDTLHIDYLASPGAIVGCDYSGVVEEVGKAVTNGLRKGDRVAGFTHGGIPPISH